METSWLGAESNGIGESYVSGTYINLFFCFLTEGCLAQGGGTVVLRPESKPLGYQNKTAKTKTCLLATVSHGTCWRSPETRVVSLEIIPFFREIMHFRKKEKKNQ